MAIKSNLAKILPTASLKKAKNSIPSNIYKPLSSALEGLDSASNKKSFNMIKNSVNSLGEDEVLSRGARSKIAKQLNMDEKNMSAFTNPEFTKFLKNNAESMEDVSHYVSSLDKKIDKASSRFTNKAGESILSDSAESTFSSSASLMDKAKAISSKENLGTYLKGTDLEGGLMNNKATMAGRYALGATAVTGAVDAVQFATGQRTLTRENGERNIPVVPFI